MGKTAEMHRTPPLMDRYMNVSPEMEANAQRSMEELSRKYGSTPTKRFFDAALQLGAINTRLMEKALNSAETFISGDAVKLPDFERKFTEAANALNYALAHTKNPSMVEVYVGMFEGKIMEVHRWQLWHLADYAKKANNLLVFYSFAKKLPEFGREPIDYRPLVEMAAKVGPEKAGDIFNGKSPDSEKWLKDAARHMKLSAVIADHIIHYLSVLANVLAGKTVSLIASGDKFSTDGERIFVPPMFGMFPTREENKGAYTKSTYHEAGHISSRSFVVNALKLDLSEAGWSFEVLKKEEDGIKVCKDGDPKKHFTAKTTMHLLKMFENQELARVILNIIEDRRVDARVMKENQGLAEEYAAEIERFLQFRPVAIEGSNAAHVLEAFTQLVIIGKTRETMGGELSKAVIPLVEIARVVPLDSPDATNSVHAMIKVYNLLIDKFPALKNPMSIPMPDNWNEGEDHDGIGDPVIVRVKSEGEEGEGGGSGCGQGLEWGEDDSGEGDQSGEGDEKDGAKDDAGTDKEGKGGAGGKEDEEKDDAGKKDGSGGKKDKGKKDGEDEGKKEKQNGYGNPWKRGAEIKAKDGEPASFMPDFNAPGGSVKERSGTYKYPQWDYKLGLYLPGWADVKETRVELKPGFRGMAEGTRNVSNAVKTAFRRIKPLELKVKTGLPEGEDIDFAKLIEWTVAAEFGEEREEDFYTQRKRTKRSVATMLLVDASGSTSWDIKGRRVITVENEACEVFSAALEELHDPHAICAYNSNGRENTYFYIAKDFDEKKTGMPNFQPAHANRDGAAIRHATAKMLERKEKKKFLFIISDGKPNDCGEYVDMYAMKDTRKAVEEAANKGIVVFCVSVRPEGEEQGLRDIYGEGRVCPISDINKLPLILPLLYRKLSGV